MALAKDNSAEAVCHSKQPTAAGLLSARNPGRSPDFPKLNSKARRPTDGLRRRAYTLAQFIAILINPRNKESSFELARSTASRLVEITIMASETWTTVLGLAAAALTSLSYIPQVRKAFPRDATDDISLKMLIALFTGLALWIVYGITRGDLVIVAANGVGAILVGTVLIFKIRDLARK